MYKKLELNNKFIKQNILKKIQLRRTKTSLYLSFCKIVFLKKPIKKETQVNAGQYGDHLHYIAPKWHLGRPYKVNSFQYYFNLAGSMAQTTVKADCRVDETRDARVWVANCWICFFASLRHLVNPTMFAILRVKHTPTTSR